MKHFCFVIICSVLPVFANAQVRDANYIVNYSNAIICGMDEESFSKFEEDWQKDKSEVNSKLIEGMLAKVGDYIIFRKNSLNTVLVDVVSITEKGGFNCNMSYLDSANNIVAQEQHITISKGGTFGSKLNLIKDGAKKEGVLLGRVLKKITKK